MDVFVKDCGSHFLNLVVKQRIIGIIFLTGIIYPVVRNNIAQVYGVRCLVQAFQDTHQSMVWCAYRHAVSGVPGQVVFKVFMQAFRIIG